MEIRDYFLLTSMHFIVYNEFFVFFFWGGVFIYFSFVGKEKGWAMYFENLVKKFLHCLISLQCFFFFFLINFL